MQIFGLSSLGAFCFCHISRLYYICQRVFLSKLTQICAVRAGNFSFKFLLPILQQLLLALPYLSPIFYLELNGNGL